MRPEEIEFVTLEENSVKLEDDAGSDDNFEKDAAEFFEDAVKCADIFIFKERKFLFSCYFCGGHFTEFPGFMSHIIDIHVRNEEQDDTEQPSIIEEDSEYNFEEDGKEDVEKILDYDATDLSISESEQQEDPLESQQNIKLPHNGSTANARNKNSMKPIQCRYCTKKFKLMGKLKQHEQRHKDKEFDCKICSKSFASINGLRLHLEVHSEERNYECEDCPSAFKNKANLIMHVKRLHQNIEEKPHPCHLCTKRFMTTSELKTHIRSHTGENPFECPDCGTGFKTSSAMLAHRNRVHLNIRNFCCEICGKKFTSGSVLRDHMIVHKSKADRPFECDICEATFPRRRALRTHKKIHSEVKEYVCQFCDKAFAQRPGLCSHLKTHGIGAGARKKKSQEEDSDQQS